MSVIRLASQVTYTYVIANTEGPYCETTDKFVVSLTTMQAYSGKVLAQLSRVNSYGNEEPIFKKEIPSSESMYLMEKEAIQLVENYLKGEKNG